MEHTHLRIILRHIIQMMPAVIIETVVNYDDLGPLAAEPALDAAHAPLHLLAALARHDAYRKVQVRRPVQQRLHVSAGGDRLLSAGPLRHRDDNGSAASVAHLHILTEHLLPDLVGWGIVACLSEVRSLPHHPLDILR